MHIEHMNMCIVYRVAIERVPCAVPSKPLTRKPNTLTELRTEASSGCWFTIDMNTQQP